MSNRDTLLVGFMRKGMSLAEAEALLEGIDVPEAPTPEPLTVGVPLSQGAWNAGDSVQVRGARGAGETAIAARFSVAPRGADGLTAEQARGRAQGITNCPNCQRPVDNHLPGCSRIPGTGSDARAVTKGVLPPS